jgi:hypothetical protein
VSNISDAFDALKARLAAVFPDHTELTNPYQVDHNSDLILAQGYGIAIGPAVNTERNLSCKLSVGRTIIIVLTRSYFATETQIALRETGTKLLLEDQFLIIKDLEKDPTAGNSTAIAKLGYQSDSGILPVKADADNFLKLESTFNIEYFEDLN